MPREKKVGWVGKQGRPSGSVPTPRACRDSVRATDAAVTGGRLPTTRHPPRKRRTQYAAAIDSISNVSGILGRPVKQDDDSCGCVSTNTTSRSRGAFRPRFAVNFPPSSIRGRGEAGRPMRPIAACAMVEW